MELHGQLEPTTVVVLKVASLNSSATARILNALDVRQTYTPVPV